MGWEERHSVLIDQIKFLRMRPSARGSCEKLVVRAAAR